MKKKEGFEQFDKLQNVWAHKLEEAWSQKLQYDLNQQMLMQQVAQEKLYADWRLNFETFNSSPIFTKEEVVNARLAVLEEEVMSLRSEIEGLYVLLESAGISINDR